MLVERCSWSSTTTVQSSCSMQGDALAGCLPGIAFCSDGLQYCGGGVGTALGFDDVREVRETRGCTCFAVRPAVGQQGTQFRIDQRVTDDFRDLLFVPAVLASDLAPEAVAAGVIGSEVDVVLLEGARIRLGAPRRDGTFGHA